MSPATDAGKSRIPMLQIKDLQTKRVIKETTDNVAKGQLFYNTFFPPRNPATTPVSQNHQYPTPRWEFQNISNNQIHCVIKKMKPYKAMKSGSVPNSILLHAREDLVPHLGPPVLSHQHTKLLPTGMGNYGDISLEKTRKTRLHLTKCMATHSTIRWTSTTTQQLPSRRYRHHVRKIQHPACKPLRSQTRMNHH